MSVLVFRHVRFEGLGLILPVLQSAGLECEYADLRSGDLSGVDLRGYDGLISMGGPMSANDNLPSIKSELRVIELAHAAGIPMLGVCLGAQLIAKALGAKVYRNRVKEIGWFPIEFSAAASEDRLFAGMRAETVFHWHGETFDLPENAVLLASSRDCRHQAYRLDENVYGLQFHLEVTPEMIADWCEQDANRGDVRDLKAPVDPRFNAARMTELSATVFGRWAALAKAKLPKSAPSL